MRSFVAFGLIAALALSFAACNFQVGNQMNDLGELDADDIEGARAGLSILDIQYTMDEFVERARQSDEMAVKLFLITGMNPNARNATGKTALIVAASQGHANIVMLLMENNATIDLKDKEGNTALSYAETNGFPEVAKLIKQGPPEE